MRPSKLDRLYRSRWGRAFISGFFVFLVILLVRQTHVITYLNNDDANIMHTLAGDFTGIPYPSHPFINVLLGLVVSTLYSLMPGVSIWAFCHLAALFLSLTAITATLIKAFYKKGFPKILPFIAAGILIVTVYVYAITKMTFTLTAALSGTAALGLILTFGMDSRDTYKPFWAIVIIPFFAFACFAFRNSAGFSLLPFWLLALVYRYFTIRADVPAGRSKRGYLYLSLIALLTALVAIGMPLLHSFSVEALNGADFVAFDEARGHYMDYPHDSFSENPTLYENLGWDETLYELVERRFFLDERVTGEALECIYRDSAFRRLPLPTRVAQALRLGIETARGNGPLQYSLVSLILCLALAILAYRRRRKGLIPLLTCICFGAGGFLLCFVLCYTGRFPLRTFQLIAFPTALGMALTTLALLEPRCALSADFTRKQRMQNLAIFAISATLIVTCAVKTGLALKSEDPTATLRASRDLQQYAIDHPTKVFLRSPLTGYDIDPYLVYSQHHPANLVDWGGTSMHTGFQRRQCEYNDIPALDDAFLKRDDLYYVARNNSDEIGWFYRYLTERFGAVQLTMEGSIGENMTVYRIVFPA